MARRRHPTESDRARLARALAFALALHALVALVLVTLDREEVPDRRVERIAIELREAPVPAPPRVVAEPPRDPPKVVQRKRRAPRPAPAPSVIEPPPLQEAPSTEPLAIAPEPSGSGSAGSRERGADEGGSVGSGVAQAPSGMDPGRVRLFDPRALGVSIGRWKSDVEGLGEGEADHRAGDALSGDPEAPEAERSRIAGRIARDLTGADSGHRVDGALVDPYFAGLAKDLRGRVRVHPRDLSDRDRREGPRTGNFLSEWLPKVNPANEYGSPLTGADPLADHVGDARPAGREDGTRSILEFCARWNDGQFAPVKAWVVLQLVQLKDGRPLSATVLGSSGHGDVERIARETVLAMADASDPPDEGLGLGGARIKSIWRFEAKVLRKAWNCRISGRFEEELAKVQLDDPLAREVVVTDVVLVAVVGGATGPVPAAP